MNCFIIDDEEMSRDSLKWHCSKIESLNVIGEFSNPVKALSELEKNTPDLIFLDIHMPELSGMEFLRSASNLPQVILTTTDGSFALDAFEYNVVDYLVKPVSFSRFLMAYNKVKKVSDEKQSQAKKSDDNTDIYINIDKRLIRLDVESILFVKADGDYVHIQTEKEKHLVHTTLKKIKEKLSADTFLQVHRSFIINMNKVVDIQDNSIVIQKEVIPVSRSNRGVLMQRLNRI